MNKLSFKDDALLAQEKEKFVTHGTCDTSIVRHIIFDSWKRSRNAGVDLIKPNREVISQKLLSEKLKENESLMTVASRYIENIYSFVKGSGFAVSLSDKNGYVLNIIGDENITNNSNQYSSFREGANRNELYFGTNAIGTSIVVDQPLQIYGAEHYVKTLEIYTCSAAPIHDELNNIIGCINLTGPKENVHSHTLGMVVAAVDGIEKELKINNAYNKIHTINSQLTTILNSIDSALIVISANGKILNINKVALNTFNLDYKSSINKKINDVLNYDVNKINLENIHKNYSDIELEVQYTKYNVSISSYKNKYEQSEGFIISFKEMKQIHKMVNRYSGFIATYTIDNIIGQSSQISYVKNLCVKAAKSSSNVLILGESGTGKELVAQSIHNASSRSKEPFIAINCGALPKGLIESELFGYEGGSFTGASKEGKPGKFELADGGTIFLDEIGDMPLDTQVTLLRVLQNKEILRIGGRRPKSIDVRVIAATNKNLFECIQNNSFRKDLYYRLNVFTITVPPLRDRIKDLKDLSNHFIKHYNDALNKNVSKIDANTYSIFEKYPWSGNVRELENVLERAINIVDSDTITLKDIPSYLYNEDKDNVCYQVIENNSLIMNNNYYDDINHNQFSDLTNKKLDLEKEEIIKSLTFNEGIAVKTAEHLGISRRTLYRKLEKYNISIENFRK